MKNPTYLESIEFERAIRIKGRTEVDPHATALWNRAIAQISDEDSIARLTTAYDFARAIKYTHDGLNSDVYFAHPLRVGALALLSQQCQNIDAGIVGLIHNIFELSDIPEKMITDIFGKTISDQLLNLKVDREIQWDQEYKRRYYAKINSDPVSARVVKIIDKLDNIFVLHVNPDEITKKKYLLEIETYIMPMIENDMPELTSYMIQLIKEESR